MVVIVAEGRTDIEFLEDLISSEFGISREKYEFKNFEGKDNIFNRAHKIYNEIEKDLDIIHGMFIVVDADYPKDTSPIRGYDETQEALTGLIRDLDFGLPTENYIFCDNNKKGFLESFLLSTLDDKQKKCIADFKKCYSYELSDKWAYNTFYKQKKHPFDFSHPNFSELKTKLQTLFEGTE